ncbi:MAG TPA: transglycosylase SLT domain-containing protein [Usitatibacter sp.]|nr:transglycosylase SLT domain-containing protein [Usitatibacter sp.]
MTLLKRLLNSMALCAALAAPLAFGSTEAVKDAAPALPALPDPDLWQRIRMGLVLEPLDSPLVHEHEAWYASRPEYIKRFVDRGSRYLHHIVEEVEKRGMPMEIALLPVIESAFTPKAMSRAKASGIWQFIPSTGKSYGLQQDWWRDNRNDVIKATDAALNYLQRLHDMFGTWEHALAAYNCGEGCVGRAIAANQKRGLPTDFLSLKLPPETRNYVPKLIAVKNIVLSPGTYGIEIDSIPDQPYFTTVQAPARIDVKLAAKLAGMSDDEFLALNPAHNKPVAVASASGVNTLVLPLDKAETFRANLLAYDKPLVTWTQYAARRGESLDAIAKRHGVSGGELRAANDSVKLDRKGRLRAAGPVLVPMRGQATHLASAGKTARVTVSTPTASSAGSPRAVAASAVAKAAPAAAGKPAVASAKTYTVRAGDTLYSIAQRFGTAVDTLRRVNRLAAHAVIRPGLTLQLPQ